MMSCVCRWMYIYDMYGRMAQYVLVSDNRVQLVDLIGPSLYSIQSLSPFEIRKAF